MKLCNSNHRFQYDDSSLTADIWIIYKIQMMKMARALIGAMIFGVTGKKRHGIGLCFNALTIIMDLLHVSEMILCFALF